MMLAWLRWSVALVLGAGAVLLLVSLAQGGHPGVPAGVAIALAGTEVIAAVAFVIPRTRRVGGWMLLAVLAAATVLHVVAGQVPPASFLVYAAAIAVAMPGRAS